MLILQCHDKCRSVSKYARPKTTPRTPTICRGNRSRPKRFAEAHEILRVLHFQLQDV